MAPKRIDSATTQSRDAPKPKRPKHSQQHSPFTYHPRDWSTLRNIDDKVALLRNRTGRTDVFYIVKKTLRIEANSANDPKPFEMRVLALLPKCNRIVHALACVASDDPQLGIALFRFYPSGDLADWKKGEFDNKNHKPVPESYIWRFFVQMTQALAFIHNFIGPKKEERHCILHRDIKPTNILVVKNGTTYPSFRLHDFGCASVWQEDKEKQASYCGTFDWQPPENPFINTVAADVWALGACVHFLATGQKPIMNTEESRALCLQRVEQSMTTMGECSSPNRYYAASVPRRVLPINIDAEEQLQRGIAGLDAYNRQYSDELDGWMRRCLQERSENRPSTLELLRDVSVVAQKLLKCMGGVAALADMEVKF